MRNLLTFAFDYWSFRSTMGPAAALARANIRQRIAR